MNDPVYVFIASRRTTPTRTRVLWQVEREDAKRLCSDSRTATSNHMLCWTAQPGVPEEDWTWVEDNGMYDQVLSDLGIETNEWAMA
ncbi:hypothetical protein EF910_05515 [Streptomyces sp. WAC07149]|uniref:hypothetical protein n=1 Tax=Streptomyces sp. WAC07149 TaxID=2487425 RepID=UPI000F7A4ECA|nr:hypothetical protein [Streptomyces sp. WAC07149]RST07895.1 hypothetical protein EF910_05515 [Streptomyces sp. WAC07149]